MPESRRKFRRFNLPLEVKFRPTYGAKDYSRGAVTNLSCEGLGLDAHDFRFILYENLEMILTTPVSEGPVSLFGDIVWKKQNGKRCLAGIKFRMKDTRLQEAAIERIFASSDIPLHEAYNKDPDYIIRETTGRMPVTAADVQCEQTPGLPHKLGFIKQYYENGARCKVTFRLIGEMARNTQNVSIVGDFNNWNVSQSPMTRLKNGDFVITMDLPAKREYRYRFLIDGLRWENDWYADKFVPNEFGSKDSVVIV
jgi:hypothetical protein